MGEILIKGMEMPEGCYYCPILIGKANCSCVITGTQIRIEKVREELEDERLPDCPLVELPPHGRLIDADAFKKYCETGLELINRELHGDALKMATAVTESFCKDIDEAPTVLETSK